MRARLSQLLLHAAGTPARLASTMIASSIGAANLLMSIGSKIPGQQPLADSGNLQV
jgi:hypothetical protein